MLLHRPISFSSLKKYSQSTTQNNITSRNPRLGSAHDTQVTGRTSVWAWRDVRRPRRTARDWGSWCYAPPSWHLVTSRLAIFAFCVLCGSFGVLSPPLFDTPFVSDFLLARARVLLKALSANSTFWWKDYIKYASRSQRSGCDDWDA